MGPFPHDSAPPAISAENPMGTDGLELLEFEAGVELRIDRDKGGAVEAILDEADADAPVAYLLPIGL